MIERDADPLPALPRHDRCGPAEVLVVSVRPVRCPHCRSAIIAERRPIPSGAHFALGDQVQAMMAPGKRNVVLLTCPFCNGVAEWTGKRILIIDA